METLVINSEKELKAFVEKNRKRITNINGVSFGELYPMVDISSKHATYYDVETQGNKYLSAPFNVTTK